MPEPPLPLLKVLERENWPFRTVRQTRVYIAFSYWTLCEYPPNGKAGALAHNRLPLAVLLPNVSSGKKLAYRLLLQKAVSVCVCVCVVVRLEENYEAYVYAIGPLRCTRFPARLTRSWLRRFCVLMEAGGKICGHFQR